MVHFCRELQKKFLETSARASKFQNSFLMPQTSDHTVPTNFDDLYALPPLTASGPTHTHLRTLFPPFSSRLPYALPTRF